MTQQQHNTERHRPVRLLVTCALLAVVAAGVTLIVVRRQAPERDWSVTDVPLGVEEAVIIRYNGPRLVARPYRRGASVNLRIANERQVGNTRVYDVRYVVNLPGEFDVTEYLMSADGTAIDDLPAFTVNGLTSLTKDIETRIQEIEKVEIHIWHWYRETLVVLFLFWIMWLLGLIFIGRPRRAKEEPRAPPPPAIETRIQRLLDALGKRELTLDEKTQLEALLLLHWRDRLGFDRHRLASACRRIQGSSQAGHAYRRLQTWLHAPHGDEGGEEFLKTHPLSVGDGGTQAGRRDES
jgi:hypothetical protein